VIAALLAVALVSPAAEDPIEDACYKADESQQGMNRCAGEAYQRADKALNEQWLKVAADYLEDAESKKLLLDGQRAWINYRDAQCELAASDSKGGSIWPLINSSCLADLTRQRTKELADLLGEGN